MLIALIIDWILKNENRQGWLQTNVHKYQFFYFKFMPKKNMKYIQNEEKTLVLRIFSSAEYTSWWINAYNH
jgi:hypothetical protein